MSANPAIRDRIGAEQVGGDADILLRSLSCPIVLRPAQPLSDDQLLEFCAANDSLRIERNPAGELIVMTPSGGKTSNRESFLSRELDLWAEQDGNGVSFNASGGFSLPDGSVRAADAAWLSSNRWNSLTREQQGEIRPLLPGIHHRTALPERFRQRPGIENGRLDRQRRGTSLAH